MNFEFNELTFSDKIKQNQKAFVGKCSTSCNLTSCLAEVKSWANLTLEFKQLQNKREQRWEK